MFFLGTVYELRGVIWSSIGLLGLSSLIVSFMLVKYGISKIPYLPTFDDLVRTDLEDYFTEINLHYAERGLWWRVVPGHYWLELRIDESLK